MKEAQTASYPLAILIRNEEIKSWEERVINPPAAPSRPRRLGGTLLGYVTSRRLYEYTDALAAAALAIDHLILK